MSWTRVVDSQWAVQDLFSITELRRIKVFIWRDPSTEDTLRALTFHREVCPLIIAYRKHLDKA